MQLNDDLHLDFPPSFLCFSDHFLQIKKTPSGIFSRVRSSSDSHIQFKEWRQGWLEGHCLRIPGYIQAPGDFKGPGCCLLPGPAQGFLTVTGLKSIPTEID